MQLSRLMARRPPYGSRRVVPLYPPCLDCQPDANTTAPRSALPCLSSVPFLPRDTQRCQLHGCNKQVFFDERANRVHDFCSLRHASMAKSRGEWPPQGTRGASGCQLPGCDKLVYRNPSTGEVREMATEIKTFEGVGGGTGQACSEEITLLFYLALLSPLRFAPSHPFSSFALSATRLMRGFLRRTVVFPAMCVVALTLSVSRRRPAPQESAFCSRSHSAQAAEAAARPPVCRHPPCTR